MKHFYPQGLPLTPSELLEATSRAISQEDRIYHFMKEVGADGKEWTAWDLLNWHPKFCITSIRRALFNLEKQGKVAHSGFTPGPFGKPVGKYIVFTGKLF